MIDWQLVKDGKGIGGKLFFPDFVSQSYFLHMIDVGAGPLDEYGLMVYKAEDMKRLKRILQNWLTRHEVVEDILFDVQTREYTGQVSLMTFNFIFDDTCRMIDEGLEIGAELHFFGD